MGRRGQGQDRRHAGRAGRRGRPLPGRQQRRPHAGARRRHLQAAAGAERHPLAGHPVRDRQRLRDRPRGADGGAGRPGAARHRPGRLPHLRKRAPDHALAPHHRRRLRADAGPAADRHHPPRHRPRLRRQGLAGRHPRAGPARREDPAPEDPDRAVGQERAAAQDLPPAPDRQGRDDRGHAALRGADPAVHRRHVADREPCAGRGQGGAVRGSAGDPARPRPRHLPVRDQLQPDRRRRLRRARLRADPHRRRAGCGQGVRDAGGRGRVPQRGRPGAGRADPRRRAPSTAPSPAASAAAAGSTWWRCATPPG